MKLVNYILPGLLAYSQLANCHAVPNSAKSSARTELPIVYENGVVNLDSLNEKLANCEVVKQLSDIIANSEKNGNDDEDDISYIDYLFSKLFPFGPSGNAILATAYISGPPNFILAMIPASIDVSSLSLLVSFAIGGLLGDVFLHLLPQTFLGEPLDKDSATFVLVDERRNCILGLFIFIGFLIFFIIDKSLRILEHTGDEDGESHGHSHSHSHTAVSATSSSVETKDSKTLKKRGGKKEPVDEEEDEPVISNPNSSIKTSAYLNLISDFSHNITDGLAIAASFYISKNVGCTTTLAVFFHEIPHEVGDFALLIQGGFTKWQAMNSQFITAIGAFLGTFIGIAIQNIGSSSDLVGTDTSIVSSAMSPGLWGTTVEVGDLTLPFTAGGFLYIATVGVIPEVLELSKGTTRFQEFTKGIMQVFFVLVGIFLMFCIAWFE